VKAIRSLREGIHVAVEALSGAQYVVVTKRQTYLCSYLFTLLWGRGMFTAEIKLIGMPVSCRARLRDMGLHGIMRVVECLLSEKDLVFTPPQVYTRRIAYSLRMRAPSLHGFRTATALSLAANQATFNRTHGMIGCRFPS
jgi:hypothetical protein